MNLKKYLQQQAEKDAEIFLTEDDELFIEQLVEDDTLAAEVRKSRSKKLWAPFASFATVLVAAVIIFPVVFANRGTNEIFYQEENVISTPCQFEEMQPNLKYFQIEENVESNYLVSLSYDSVSNDKLYYKVEGSTEISEFVFNIVINQNYHFNYNLGVNPLSVELSDYNLSFKQVEIDDFEAGYKGLIKRESETIYIEYKQIIDVGAQAFFDDIQSIIKVKN